mmetsp:Transcript_55871/g.147715  ORF Transcript_55871/g.147715 Transcript_55871/m.147715 type:complete len:123 (+) Transcript_55871:565-933(+)
MMSANYAPQIRAVLVIREQDFREHMVASNYMQPKDTIKEVQVSEEKVMSERPYLTLFSMIMLFVSVMGLAFTKTAPLAKLRPCKIKGCRLRLPVFHRPPGFGPAYLFHSETDWQVPACGGVP